MPARWGVARRLEFVGVIGEQGMDLSPDQYERTRQVLLGPDSDAVLDLVVTLFLHGWSAVHAGKAVSHIRELGFVTGDPFRLTRLGYLVADSMREYVFWRQRDGQMHCEGRVPHLSSAYYEGKSVLEIGCGSG